MSDEDLRELERRFASSGSDDDEDALLHARLRLGLINEDQLRAARLFGSAAATRTLGAQPPARWELDDRDEWLTALKRAGKEALVRTSLAVAELAAPVAEGSKHQAKIARALEAARSWLRDQDAARLAAAREHYLAARGDVASEAIAAEPDYDDPDDDPPPPSTTELLGGKLTVSTAASVVLYAAKAAGQETVAGASQNVYQQLREVLAEGRMGRKSSYGVPMANLREVIGAAIVPSLLGHVAGS